MLDLRVQLQNCLRGRICLLGIGNADLGDDAFGVRLVEALSRRFQAQKESLGNSVKVLIAGTNPEDFVTVLMEKPFDNIIFLDAVQLNSPAGSAVLLGGAEMTSKFPQVSTHKLSLGLLAKLVESRGTTRAWLLGVQPESLAPGKPLSSPVQRSLEALLELVCEVFEQRLAFATPVTSSNEMRVTAGQTATLRKITNPLNDNS